MTKRTLMTVSLSVKAEGKLARCNFPSNAPSFSLGRPLPDSGKCNRHRNGSVRLLQAVAGGILPSQLREDGGLFEELQLDLSQHNGSEEHREVGGGSGAVRVRHWEGSVQARAR